MSKKREKRQVKMTESAVVRITEAEKKKDGVDKSGFPARAIKAANRNAAKLEVK